MRRSLCSVATLILLGLLASCAGPSLRPDSRLLELQQQRERLLRPLQSWSLSGRLALSGPNGSGSGTLDWQQDGREFSFAVSAPVTGKTWTLSGDERQARLVGLHPQPVEDDDAAGLLQRELGWKVPVAELSSWVLGLRAPGAAEIRFREDGLPLEIEQSGWTVEYRDYDETQQPPLPRRIFASQGEFGVRLAIRHWQTR
jgi:outer membrane lipoprotein LolB